MSAERLRSALLLAAIAILAGCASPESPRAGEEPVMAGGSVERGRQLFERHCFKCHLHGGGGLAPAFVPLPRFLMRFQIRHGMGAMPAFGEEQLSDQEVEAILDYIVAQRR